MFNGGLCTPPDYGNSAQYIGFYTANGVANTAAPGRFLTGIILSFSNSNLHSRGVNVYSNYNDALDTPTRILTPGSVFVGRWGKNQAVFPMKSDWKIHNLPT